MNHDPLCPKGYEGGKYSSCMCDLISQVRTDERTLIGIHEDTT